MEVETIEADSNDLMEILKQAASGDEIIFEANIAGDGDGEDAEEVEEIVEIIEEIEEVEEPEEVEQSVGTEENEDNEIDEHMDLSMPDAEASDQRQNEDEETENPAKSSSKNYANTDTDLSQMRAEYVKKQLKKHFKNDGDKDRSKQHVNYDIDEDWEDEDLDQGQQSKVESSQAQIRSRKKTSNNQMEKDDRHSTQNGRKHLSSPNHDSSSQPGRSRGHGKIPQQESNTDETTNEYWDEEEHESIVGYEDDQSGSQNEENTDSQHEIVKNAENNLVYTVLGSKKQNNSTKQTQDGRFISSRLVKIEQHEETPTEGTIYYENEDMETLYVEQSGGDHDNYQYNNIIEGDEEVTRDSNRDDEETDNQEPQEQIFLHEDEDGQLYFKDENGKLQPVYLTPDGNYAIAENSSDDQDSRDLDQQLLRHNRLKHAREEDMTSRNYPCDSCPKRFPDQNSLARHRKSHTGDRPFQCLECHKTFPTSSTLRRHLTLHNPQSRPLPCIYCGRRFLDKASLAKHEQSHLGGEQRTHTCDICHKAFMHASDLALHKKNHDPERKFDCEVCGREFNRLNNLQRHMMVHQQVHMQGNNDEALSCDVCGITYKFMSSLTRHMVTTHVNPEKMRQQAEEQRRKRENNYRRYMENRKMYECQPTSGYTNKRTAFHHNTVSMNMQMSDNDEDA
ncbi:zinc finger and SCAN domain-containing protein 21-like isoform X5 [Diprion similis]|uniref:zinc finger and SCAN domain-containing protein 21-like isoform X5 n=1 Tax=Diprion similis TaxID=362088 RepID=UPI001EF86737|nr:zinc finger and SCAN domain-containing protein 21-like isoform X5 [Diprion similis]